MENKVKAFTLEIPSMDLSRVFGARNKKHARAKSKFLAQGEYHRTRLATPEEIAVHEARMAENARKVAEATKGASEAPENLVGPECDLAASPPPERKTADKPPAQHMTVTKPLKIGIKPVKP